MTPIATESDTDKLTFSLSTRQIGKRRKLAEIHIKQAERVVGVVKMPSSVARVSEARKWAKEMTAVLKASRLYVIEITELNIDVGRPNSPSYCAIAQALWTSQRERGISQLDWNFEADTYGAWRTPAGLIVEQKLNARESRRWHIPTERLPLIVTHYSRSRRKLWYCENMVDWSMQYDEAHADSELTKKELRKKNGDARPTPFPGPAVFVLNADSFELLEP